ncbi:alginate export family protein [Flavobacterium sp. UMI-01]|uniref:alginate export family protein n=1 Tax=Flavobacterium sp. UMI-01 TaxID=1441053 RepID=UPI001C7D0592|nr:alginate export family protein [Flavobacterium sp. UMI-01]GIZ08861.1 hypothetical protein FUMI01_15880 [Flavobacterium sp. UMI-01]
MRTKSFLLLLLLLWTSKNKAQNTEDVLNLLLQRKLISKSEVDSIRLRTSTKQTEEEKDKSFSVNLQLKNRTEYRNGYGNIPEENSHPATFVNQRTRLNLLYHHEQKLKTVVSLQDARVWGSHDPKGLNGTIQLFEGYLEPYITPHFSIRIGRQRIALDNQRLFAENDWRINGASHDAINFIYENKKLNSELIGAFNQTGERLFGTDYTPAELSITPATTTASTWTNYKALAVHYLKYEISPKSTATTIVAADAYQDAVIKEQNYWRFTYGGRIELKHKKWYATTNSFLQSGRNSTGKTINAWYIQPEIKYSDKDNFTIRLGAEIISGDNGTIGNVDHNFVPLYGVAHRFNGFMDLFTKFPNDVHSAGLFNPYAFFSKKITPKIELQTNHHLFYTQRSYTTTTNPNLAKFMGNEHDFVCTYKPNGFTFIEGGFAFVVPTDTMTQIKNFGDSDKIGKWAYIQIRVTPVLFKTQFK